MPTLLIYLACHSGIGEPFFSQNNARSSCCCFTATFSSCSLLWNAEAVMMFSDRSADYCCWIKSFKQNQSFLRWTASCSQTPFCGNTKQNDAFSRLFPKADLTVHMQLWHPVASTAWPQTRGLYTGAVLTVVYWTEKQRSWMASRHCLSSAIFTQKCPVSHSWWNPFFFNCLFLEDC